MTSMNYLDKSPQHDNEIKFDDEHVVLRFNIEDKKYVSKTYINKILMYNSMIDEVYEELHNRKLKLRQMEQHGRSKRMLWSYPHRSQGAAAKFFNDFERMEQQLETMVINRMRI